MTEFMANTSTVGGDSHGVCAQKHHLRGVLQPDLGCDTQLQSLQAQLTRHPKDALNSVMWFY